MQRKHLHGVARQETCQTDRIRLARGGSSGSIQREYHLYHSQKATKSLRLIPVYSPIAEEDEKSPMAVLRGK